MVVFVLFLTTSAVYAKHCFKISILLSFLLCSVSLMATANVKSSGITSNLGDPAFFDHSLQNDISPAGLYAIYLAIQLLFYTTVPLPLYGTIIIGVAYSVFFEMILCRSLPERMADDATVFVNIVLHVCIHVVGIHTMITTQVTKNYFFSNFMF